MPSINFKNPKLFITSKEKPHMISEGKIFDTMAASVAIEMLLNYYYEELSLKKEMDRVLLDALIGPWGVVSLGFTTETEKIDDGELLEVNELIKSEEPYVVRVSPKDFIVDPEAKDPSLADAAWVAVKWVKRLEDLKGDDKYINLEGLKTNAAVDTSFSKAKDKGSPALKLAENEKGGSKKGDWNRVEGFDIYDKRSQRIYSIVPEHKKEIQNRAWPLNYEGFPFETLFFNEDPDELVPISDIELSINNQDEINRIRSCQLDHIRRVSQRRYKNQEGTLTQEEKDKVMYGGDGTIIDVHGELGNSLIPIDDATISQDIYIIGRQLKEDNREIHGIAQFEKGTSQKFETATEPALIQQAVNTRRDERSQVFEAYIIRVMKKLLQILQQTMPEKDVPLSNDQLETARAFLPTKIDKIAGPGGQEILNPWLALDKEAIQGEYEFKIEVGSTRPINQETRKQDALTLLQTFGGHPLINQEVLAKKVFEAFEIQDTDELMRDKKEVQQEQVAQGQAVVEAEIAKDKPKRDTDLQKTIIKTEEQAKGRETNMQLELLKLAAAEDTGKEKKD